MRLSRLAAAAVAAQSVSAFKDTSPFFLFSTSRLSDSTAHIGPSDDVATAGSVKSHVMSMLNDCPSETYLVVRQPGVVDSDFTRDTGASHLRMRLSGDESKIQSRHSIGSVVGDITAIHLSSELAKHCRLEAITLKDQQLPPSGARLPQMITIDLPQLQATSDREAELSKHDAYINAVINAFPTDRYTVIYETTPAAGEAYSQDKTNEQQQMLNMDNPYPSNVHYKRDASGSVRAEASGNPGSNLPLFEKYQFFSSGIFMGGTVSLLLLLILYIGISAISGLEVSYHAFSKDFGPASQKKQQ